jgi:phosphoribosylformylglycinamidine cyclo-ligase
VLPIFKLMQEIGNVSEAEMYRTFNMGAGMVVVTSPQDLDAVKSHLKQQGASVYQIGRVTKGNREVSIQ